MRQLTGIEQFSLEELVLWLETRKGGLIPTERGYNCVLDSVGTTFGFDIKHAIFRARRRYVALFSGQPDPYPQ